MNANDTPVSGKFIWYDLMTPNANESIGFYKELLGWTTQTDDASGHYTMIKVGDRFIGGFVALPPETDPHPRWIAYVSVSDLSATIKSAEEMGGKSIGPPTDVQGAGRFAIFRDPDGAAFSAFEIKGKKWESTLQAEDPPLPGDFCWHELATPNPEKTAGFYARLFGWESRTGEASVHADYWLYKRAGKGVAGMWRIPPGSEFSAHWLLYILVDDIEKMTLKAEKLGAKVLRPPTELPQIGRFSLIRDTVGAVVALFQGVK
jgi:uncharacterized protein